MMESIVATAARYSVTALPAGEKPKKREVPNVVVPKIAHEWKYIAVQLEVEEEAEQINQDYQKVKDKCYHVIVAGGEGTL